MKILFVSVTIPSPSAPQAGDVEVYHYVCGLARRQHEVDVVCAVAPGEESRIRELEAVCRRVYAVPRSVTAGEKVRQALSWIAHFCTGPLRHRPVVLFANRLIREGEYDVVQVEFVEAGRHIRPFQSNRLVLDTVDVGLKPLLRQFRAETALPHKLATLVRLACTWRLERRTYPKYDLVLFRSEYDRDFADRHFRLKKAAVLPHLVDSRSLATDTHVERKPKSILFTGAFHRSLNRDAARYLVLEILPRVRRAVPDVEVVLAGNGPSEEMIDWARADPAVRVTGFVNDLAAEYLRATALVAPLFVGGGVITKIVDAMFCQCPVITTAIGNEGIGAQDGVHLLVAESADEFARQITRALGDSALRARISANALDFVRSRYEAEAVCERLEGLYVDFAGRTGGRE